MALRRSLVLVALLISSLMDVTAQTQIRRFLEQGRNLYYAAQFSDAVMVLSAADRLLDGSTSRPEATSVKVYLAASYFALKDNESAKRIFAEICKIDPAYNISPAEFNPSIVDLFQHAKQECAATLCETSCSALRSASANRNAAEIRKAADAAGECGCDDARRTAGEVVYAIASENYKKKQYAQAQSEFQLAIELNPALGSQVPGLGKVLVTVDGIGGRLSVDDEFQAELKPNEPYESPLIPTGKHKLKVEPAAPTHEAIAEEITVEADRSVPVVLSARPVAVSPEPSRSVDRQPRLQTATLAPRTLLDLETGNQTGDIDLMWIEINQVRHLIPQRGARFAILPDSRVFELITPDELRKQNYLSGAMGSKDRPLHAGMLIAVQTGDGSVAKLRIDSVGTTLSIRWIVYR